MLLFYDLLTIDIGSNSLSPPAPDVSGSAVGGHGSSQGERSGLGSVLRDLVKPGDENLREMNKKLQNMLEEQLTKNMHLQKVRRPAVPR